MKNETEQKVKRPEFINELHKNSEPLTVQRYTGNNDCTTYITTEKAIRICEKYLKTQTAESGRNDLLVMPKIAEMIDEIQAEHFGIMKKIELITTSDKRTITWYESAAVIREMEELKRKLSDFTV